jgi:DNA-binding transcriptional ArsR family regulator
MDKKYLMISMDDEKAKAIAGVLGNKTCQSIIDCLVEKELSEKDLADTLKLPINTVEYNLKKLLEAGLIEKAKRFFWSKKGKKIDIYKLSNKSIIISPKSKNISSKIKSLAIVTALSGIGALIINQISKIPKQGTDEVYMAAINVAESGAQASIQAPSFPVWLWFLIGSIFAITILTILNWRKDK